MPRLLPPVEHRFTPTTAPRHTQKHPDGYLTCKLKRLLEKKKFRFEDPETQKIVKMTGGDGLAIKYLWEGLQGNVQAIEGIFDRIDGKLGTNGNGNKTTITQVNYIFGDNQYLSPFKTKVIENADSSH